MAPERLRCAPGVRKGGLSLASVAARPRSSLDPVPEASSDGVRVHFDVIGLGVPVVMLPPGGFDASFGGPAGYVSWLADGFCCVPIDPRRLDGSTRAPECGGYRARSQVAVL